MKKAMQTALLLGLALLAGCAAPGAVSPAPTPELTCRCFIRLRQVLRTAV